MLFPHCVLHFGPSVRRPGITGSLQPRIHGGKLADTTLETFGDGRTEVDVISNPIGDFDCSDGPEVNVTLLPGLTPRHGSTEIDRIRTSTSRVAWTDITPGCFVVRAQTQVGMGLRFIEAVGFPTMGAPVARVARAHNTTAPGPPAMESKGANQIAASPPREGIAVEATAGGVPKAETVHVDPPTQRPGPAPATAQAPLSPGRLRLLRRYLRRIVATSAVSFAVAGLVFAFLWLNPKGLNDQAQYALVQPMVETLIGTALEVGVFVVTTVLALALILITYRSSFKSVILTDEELRFGLAGLVLPAGAAILTIMATFLFRIWVGYASFDWIGPYLGVAVPMIALLVFSMLAQLILLALASFDILKHILHGVTAETVA